MLLIHAYSRHVVPQPADWPVNFHTSGYFSWTRLAVGSPRPNWSHFYRQVHRQLALASAA
jgi:hypothetical protein